MVDGKEGATIMMDLLALWRVSIIMCVRLIGTFGVIRNVGAYQTL